MACPSRSGAIGGRAMLAVIGLLVATSAVRAQTEIVVTTNRDLQNADTETSLREAINLANAVANDGTQVVISFDPTQFPGLGGGNWTHQDGLYYDSPDTTPPTNDPNRIIVGAVELQGTTGYPFDSSGQNPTPLPAITRSNVRLDGDHNNDGIPDVRIDLTDVVYLHVAGFFVVRSWGLRVAAAQNVTIEGIDIRFGMPDPGDPKQSVPAIQFLSGTGHEMRGCTVSANPIGVETSVAAGNTYFIGASSNGAQNQITGNSNVGVYIRSGNGVVVVNRNTISGNGSASAPTFGAGVFIESGGANLIGGGSLGVDNSITGNLHGIWIGGNGNNTIQQNAISSNTRNGVVIQGSGNNLIGGSGNNTANTITNNATSGTGFNHAGIYIQPNGNGDNSIQGNTITGNGGAGIFIAGDGDNLIGGTDPGTRNLISGNGTVGSDTSQSGIDIRGDSVNDGNNRIENNLIGTNSTGTAASANQGHGIDVAGNGVTTIGGTQTASRNVISGNKLNGIRLAHNGQANVYGNHIGVSLDGGSTIGNQNNGIEITDNAGAVNLIGGTSTPQRNVISGNGTDGIVSNGRGTTTLYNNYIGLDATGQLDRGNGRHGIALSSQTTGSFTIGGRQPGQRNVISGNNNLGITIQNTPTGTSHTIQGNYIGTDADAVDAVGNSQGGIVVEGAASAQTIGGSNLGDGNIIAGNGASSSTAHGIRLGGNGNNFVLGNVIGAVPVQPTNFPQNPQLRIEGSLRNGGVGIQIDTDAGGTIQIGNTGPYEGNVIVNNGSHGIVAAASNTVTVQNNTIGAGVNSTGTFVAMANGGDGILISGSGNNLIGGGPNATNVNFSNVIAGNTMNGIDITGPGNNTINNNKIGVDLAGTSAAANQNHGISITGTGNNAVTSNQISGNTQDGVFLFAAGTNTLLGNRIGRTAAAEAATLANGQHGVEVASQATGRLVLGGTNTSEPNTISGNGGTGVQIQGNQTNDIIGNQIGATADGLAAVGNAVSGVFLQGAASTVTRVEANTISGNTVYGVHLISGQNSLRRNRIGTNSAGTAALGNGSHGVFINDPNLPTNRQGIVIGERSIANVDNGNTISGNAGDGIRIVQGGGNLASAADDLIIQNNRIGVNQTGTAALANQGDGVHLEAGVEGKLQLGGRVDGDGNLISGNTGWGVRFLSTFAYNPGLGQDNSPSLVGNRIGTNAAGDSAIANGSGGVYLGTPAGSLTGQPRTILLGDADRTTLASGFANLISGNNGPGIQAAGSAALKVQGNYIGTDGFARAAVPNTSHGVVIDATVTQPVFIGVNGNSGTPVPPLPVTRSRTTRNIIAGNAGYGIAYSGLGFAAIANNFVGARENPANNLAPIAFDSGGGNAAGGIIVGSSATGPVYVASNDVFRSGGANSGITVTATGGVGIDGNQVQYSVGSGVNLNGPGSYTVQNNTLSENGGPGLLVSSANNAILGVADLNIAAPSTVLTGANTITRNSGSGVVVLAGNGNRISGNLVQDNGVVGGVYNGTSIGLDLGPNGVADGVTANDQQTTSGQPNLLLDYPVLDRLQPGNASQADPNATTWTVAGTAPAGAQQIELYQARDPQLATPNSDPLTHHGQVEKFLVRVPVGANQRFTHTFPTGSGFVGTSDNLLLTALAIDAAGNTSEFSRNTGKLVLAASTLTVTPGSIPADGSPQAAATATLTAKDVIGTPLPGVTDVTLQVVNSTNPGQPLTNVMISPDTNGDDITDPPATTNAQGQVQATITAQSRPSCQDASLTVRGFIAGTQLPATAALSLTVGAASSTTSTIAANPAAGITADGTTASVLTITVVDATGCGVGGYAADQVRVFQVVGGQPVQTPSTGITIVQPSQATSQQAATLGQTAATVTSTVAGTYQFGFSIGGVNATTAGNLRTVSVTFVPGPVDPGSTFIANPTTVPANGASASTLTLTLRDAQGNPISGVPASDIAITATPATGVVISQPAATDVNGQTTVTVTSTQPAAVTFVAVVRGVTLTATPTVTFQVGSASNQSTLVPTPAEARPNGQDTVLLTATIRDAQGNPRVGEQVTITPATGTGVTVVGPSTPTDANGRTTATATSTQPGLVVFNATVLVNGTPTVVASAQVNFRLLDPDPAASTLSIVTDDPLLANGQRQATVTLRLVDPLGDPLAGVRPDEIAVTATMPNGTAVVNGPNEATNASGLRTFTVTSTTPGTVTISVVARGVALNQTVTATFVPYITQSYGPGLHLMGIAGNPVDPDPRQVLRTLLPDLKLARWESSQQQYRIWNEFSPTPPFAMTAGRGFWLQLNSLVTLTIVGQPTPQAPFVMPLDRGWNQVANPFPTTFTFDLDRIMIRQNGVEVGTLATAAAQALVEPWGWRWDPVLQYLLLIDPASAAPANLSGNVGVGRGWWWLVRGDNVDAVLQPPAAGARARRTRAEATPGSWLASIEAKSAAGSAQALFGADTQRLRAEVPPPAPVAQPLAIEFLDSTGRAASDVRVGPFTTRQRWDLDVVSADGGDVTLSWSGLARALPPQHKLWLVDPTTGQRVAMNTRVGYTYAATPGARRFQLELDPRGERRLNIVDLTPGSGRSRAAGVPLSLTLTAPARVTVTVRGAAGRLVRQFVADGVEGVNPLRWDARDQEGRPVPAGSYVVEVTATSDEGEVARVVRTVAVR